MVQSTRFVDIHCHLLPNIDDGSGSWDESLAMAHMAVEDGIRTIICTPHQMGGYEHNCGEMICQRVADLQARLSRASIPLQVLPGADVRIDDKLTAQLSCGNVLSLGNHRKHVLLELPHELYFPLEPVLQRLESIRMVGILSHPERNHGLLTQPWLLRPLVQAGCLMQVTAGSLCGTFGPASQRLAESMLDDGLVHFIATDAHGARARRPLMRRAFELVSKRVGRENALAMCCHHPAAVARGLPVQVRDSAANASRISRWFWSRVAA